MQDRDGREIRDGVPRDLKRSRDATRLRGRDPDSGLPAGSLSLWGRQRGGVLRTPQCDVGGGAFSTGPAQIRVSPARRCVWHDRRIAARPQELVCRWGAGQVRRDRGTRCKARPSRSRPAQRRSAAPGSGPARTASRWGVSCLRTSNHGQDARATGAVQPCGDTGM